MGQHKIVKPAARFGGKLPETPQIQQMTVRWGVMDDGSRIVAAFPRPVANWMMTPEEADGIIAAIQEGQAAARRKRVEFEANPGQRTEQ